jgi:hypothetical protein
VNALSANAPAMSCRLIFTARASIVRGHADAELVDHRTGVGGIERHDLHHRDRLGGLGGDGDRAGILEIGIDRRYCLFSERLVLEL